MTTMITMSLKYTFLFLLTFVSPADSFSVSSNAIIIHQQRIDASKLRTSVFALKGGQGTGDNQLEILGDPTTVKSDDYSDKNNDDPNNNNNNNNNNSSNPSRPLLVLLTVPMAWGTFEPAVRLVYEYQPQIPPFLFSFCYYVFAATALNGISMIMRSDESDDRRRDKHSSSSSNSSATTAGLELGTYLFVGNALQVIGLETVAADKAAFLLQLTTIFVPLLQSLLTRNLSLISKRTWVACVVALLGVALIGLDGSSGGDDLTTIPDTTAIVSSFTNFGTGDVYIMLGAIFYSFHCIRLETYAKSVSAVKLAAAKATTETIWSGLVVLFCLLVATMKISTNTIGALDLNSNPILTLAQTSGKNLLAYVQDATASLSPTTTSTINGPHWPQVILATLWTGLVTVAYTIYAQSYGQASVKATAANLIYSIQPFFTALIAFLLLGETLGVYGYVGGMVIGIAVLLVVLDDAEGGDVNDIVEGT